MRADIFVRTVQNLNVIIAQPMVVPPLHKNSVASRWPKITCASLGLYAFAGGLLSFVGWAADVPRLASWGQNGVTIQPNTTIAVMAAGAALILLVFEFLALTGFGRPEDIERAKRAGFFSHITKPFDLDKLAVTLRAIPRKQRDGDGSPQPRN